MKTAKILLLLLLGLTLFASGCLVVPFDPGEHHGWYHHDRWDR